MANIMWHTEQRKVDDLIPYEGNPRQMTEKQVASLTKSLKKFDLAEIPAINLDNMICAGHQRMKILQLLGRGQEIIDVRVPSRQLTEKEFQQYLLTSNKVTGEWDTDLLANFDEDLLLDVGWEQDEIDFMFDLDTEEVGEDDFDVDKAVAESKFRVVRGDLIEIGQHRLLCGDSTSNEDVARLMDGGKADMVFTDPPYGIDYGKKNRLLNSFQKGGRNLKDIANDTLGKDELFNMLVKSFSLAYQYGHDYCSYYVTAPQGGELGMMMMMMMMMMMSNLPVKHILIWNKNYQNFSLGRLDYEYKHEPILYTWKKTHKFYGKGQFGNSVWDIAKERKCDVHPTMKPLALMTNMLLNSSQRNEICLDIFLGSGSTMVACHQTGRRCYGMEIDEKYCSVILERMLKIAPTVEVKKNGQGLDTCVAGHTVKRC